MNIYPCYENPFARRVRQFYWISENKNTLLFFLSKLNQLINRNNQFKRRIIMRLNLILFITLMACMHVTGKVHAQKVTLNLKNAKLSEVLKQIQKQTGYDPFYDSEQIKAAKRITISIKDVDLQEVLDSCLKDQPFVYKILNKTIVLSYKSPPPAPKPLKITIRGRVIDESNSPIPGVSVHIKGTNIGTQTDANGEYTIEADPNGTLIFSHLGFESYEQKINGQIVINMTMAEATNQLTETVVKGYYNTSKALNTGNVSSVKSDAIGKQPVGDVITALEGRVPGLYISQNSGIPGATFSIKLRGQNSLRSDGNNPLYVIDNIPYNTTNLIANTVAGVSGAITIFSGIRPNDIESIEILKDADATAIYGSRGANGVILITTKKGKEGKSKLDFNLYSGAGVAARRLDLMNTQEYLEMRREAFKNDNATPGATAYDLNGGWGDVNKDTDWQKEMIGGNSSITDAQVSISGGNSNTQYLIGGGYRRETTVFPGDYRNRRISSNVNINHQSDNKRFRAGFTMNYVNDNNRVPTSDFTENILLAPNAPLLYSPDGKLNWQNSTWANPLWPTTRRTVNALDNWSTSINLGFQLTNALSITTRGGYSDMSAKASNINPFVNYDPAVEILPNFRTHQFGSTQQKSWIIEPGLNYNATFGKAKLETLVGATFQQNDQVGTVQVASGFASVGVINDISSATTVKVSGFTDSRYRYTAIYARIGLNYDDKYLLNITGRRDGSSRFGPGKQFGNFGAVGAAWLFQKERFFERLTWLSYGKIRTSYGITGSDQIGDYKFLSSYSSNTEAYQQIVGLVPTQLTNPKFGWETVKKLEAALELGFINNRFLLNLSWYQNRTGNQLVGLSLPGITGFSNVQANLPAVIQNTGFELEVTTENINNGKFSWSTTANISVPRNKLVSYPNLEGSSYAGVYTIGMPLSSRYYYTYTGINPTTGVYEFKDENKDGAITFSGDRTPYKVDQNFFGGVQNSLSFSGLQLDFFFQFVKQNGFDLLSIVAPGGYTSQWANQPKSIIHNPSIQRYSQRPGTPASSAYSLFQSSNGSIVDASFIRLKNVSLSWDLPDTFRKPLKLSRARIFILGQNLITITNYKGLDPEISGFRGIAGLRLPPLRMITAGIQISL